MSLGRISSRPVILWGLKTSSNVLTPATYTLVYDNSLYGLTPRLGALLASPLLDTEIHLGLRRKQCFLHELGYSGGFLIFAFGERPDMF